MMSASSQGVDSEMQRFLGNKHYHRVQPRAERTVDLADVSPEALACHEEAAETQYRMVDEITRFLLENHDQRRPGEL